MAISFQVLNQVAFSAGLPEHGPLISVAVVSESERDFGADVTLGVEVPVGSVVAIYPSTRGQCQVALSQVFF